MNSRIKWLSVVTALVMLITSALPFAALASGDADGDLIDLSSSNPAQESNMQAEPGDASPDTGTAIEFIEDAGAAEENAGDETTQRSEDVNNAAAPADNTQQTASDTDANTVDNNDSPGEEGAPAVDSSAAVQQDTPAEDTVIDAEPVVDPVPEQDIAPVIDLSNALSDRTFGRDPYDGKVDNCDNVSGKASFKATMALDKIRLTVSSSNINYKSLSMPGFANAGNATISVYKWFEIEYENENGKTQKKKVTAPFIENVSASAAMSLTNLDKGYGEFEGAIPGAQATFLNCYFIDIVNVPSGLSGEFVVKGKTTGLSEENNKAGASVSAYVKCGDSDNTLGFESVRFTYTAPETEPEPEPVPEEQNGDVQDDNAGEETVTPDESDVPEVANDSGDQAGEDTQPVVEEDKSSADNTPAEPTVQEPVAEDKIDGTTPVDGTPSADDNTDTSENNENKEEEIAPVVDEPAPARGLSSKKGGALLGSPDRSASAYTIKIGAAYTYSSAYGLMNDYPLSGVSIKVTDENGYENSITTGEDGIASIADLPEGEYTLTVTGYNDTDYVANKTSESITWNSDASNTMARLQQDGNGDLVHVVFGFRMKAKERTLKITLKDKTSGDPISGMTVRVGDVSDVTNDNGYVELTATTSGPFQVALGLDGTDYNNQENAQVIPGRAYDDMSPTTIEATYELVKNVPSNETEEATAAKIKVTVVDADDESVKLEGVTVTLYQYNGTEYAVADETSTNSSGIALFEEVDPDKVDEEGNVELAFGNFPDGYIAQQGNEPIEVHAGATSEFTLKVKKANYIDVAVMHSVHVDLEGGAVSDYDEVVVGAKVRLHAVSDGNNAENDKIGTTSTSEEPMFKNLTKGDYVITLEEVPSPYKIVEGQRQQTATLADTPVFASFRVDDEDTTTPAKIEVIVVDADDETVVLEGVKVKLCSFNGSAYESVAEQTTDSNGKAVFEDVDPESVDEDGNVELAFSNIPDGYVKTIGNKPVKPVAGTTTKYTLQVSKANYIDVAVMHGVHVEPEGGAVSDYDEGVVGAKIRLHAVSDGDSTENDKIGTTVANSEDPMFTGLAKGEYVLTLETVPSPYLIIDGQDQQSVTLDDEPVHASFRVDKGEEPETGTITITVEDTEGNPVEGIQFTVARMNAYPDTTEHEPGDNEIKTMTTNEDGIAEIEISRTGTYKVKLDKTSVPDQYSAPDYTNMFTITAGAECTDTIVLADASATGSIKVAFVYTEGDIVTPVVGAVAKVGETSVPLPSDENGISMFEGLEPGEYTLTIVSMPEEYACEYEPINVTVAAGAITPVNVNAAKKPEVPTTATVVVTVIDGETEDPVEGVTVTIKTDDPDDEGTEAVTLEDGKATFTMEAGEYMVSISDIPAKYEDLDYSAPLTVEGGKACALTVKLTPAEIEPEDLEIVSFTGLTPEEEEIEVVPTTDYEIVLDGYEITFNKKDAVADQITFKITPVANDMQVQAKFDGTAMGYDVIAIFPAGTAGGTSKKIASVEALTEEGCAVEFDSSTLPYFDPETLEIDPEKDGGFFPENAESIWFRIYQPSKDFAVNTFVITGTTDASFVKEEFRVDTKVLVGGLDDVNDTHQCILKRGEPEAVLTIQGSAAKLNTGDSINYTVNFENTSKVKYQNATLEVVVDSKLIPSRLNPGMWTGYNGEIEIISVGTDGSTKSLMTINPNECGAIMLTETSVKSFRFVTKAAVAGDVSIENIVLDGEFVDAGTAKTSAKFNGTIAEGVYCTADSGEITTEIVKPEEPVTTGTISVTVKDAAGNPVKDVVFTVAPVTGNDGVPVTMKTDGNGVAQIECNIGKYKVTLSGGIPDKYKDPAFSKEIDVSGGAVMTETVTLEEKPITTGTIEITAILDGAEEETPVQGVKFTLYRKTEGAESIKIGTGVTQENGVLTDTLEAGEYLLKSAGVPDGYEDMAYEKEITITAGETTKEKVFVKKSSQPTPTPTPDPGSDPVPPGPSGGGSGTDPTPTPEPVMLFVDSPKITSNSSSVAYGEDALFYIRGLNARGMELTDYYVLHLMIPTGIQVKTLTFPGFGTDTRVTLTYESGTTELGVYNGGETVNLTERQGMNLRYIAFQIHGVDSVSATGDIQLLVKNISARDRIVTLQAILSLRDNRTKVISDNLNKRGEITPSRTNIPSGMTAQNSDRYNISVAGPKSSNSGSSGTTGTTGTTSESGSPVTEMAASVRVRKCYPQMCFSSSKVEPKVIVIDKKSSTKPLLANSVNVMPGVRSVTDAQIVDQPVTNELIAAKVKQKTAALKRIVLALNKVNPKSMNK